MDREGGNKERVRKFREKISLHFLFKAAAGCATLLLPCLSCLICFSLFGLSLEKLERQENKTRKQKHDQHCLLLCECGI